MIFLRNRNINDTPLMKVSTVLGYDIYIPNIYYTALSFMNKGCPLWLCYNENGDCDVYEITNKDSLEMELIEIIKKQYPKRSGYYCCPLNDNAKKQYGIKTKDMLGLSAICLDESDNIKAIVVIDLDDNNKEQAIISFVTYENEDALKKLRRYIFSESNIKNNRGLMVLYEGEDVAFVKLFELYEYNGIHAYQFE